MTTLSKLPPITYNFKINPNRVSEERGALPWSSAGRGIVYGHIFHKIMEDIIKTREFDLGRKHPMLELMPIKQGDFMRSKIQQLLEMEEFQEILKMEVRTEVSIGLQGGEEINIGRIDLMAICEDKIIILDYKTDKNPPPQGSEIPIKYKEQLEFYRSAMTKIYPSHKIETRILWLENLTFTSIT